MHPLTAGSRTLVVAGDARHGHRLATELAGRPVEPTAVCWSAGRLLVRVEGTDVGIEEQLGHADLPGGAVLSGPEEEAVRAAEADLVRGAPGETVFRVGGLPSRFPDLVELVEKLVAEQGIAAAWSASLGVGVHTVGRGGAARRARRPRTRGPRSG